MIGLLFALLLLANAGLALDPELSAQAQTRAEALDGAGLHHDIQPYLQEGDCAVGEVLSRGLAPAAAFSAWVQSPAHHSVMTDPAFDRAGIGVAGDVIVVAYRGACPAP